VQTRSLTSSSSEILPLLSLRGTVAFPGEILQLVISRPQSVKAVEAALDRNGRLLLVMVKSDAAEPTATDLHSVGTIAAIQKLLRLPDDSVRVTLQGLSRAKWQIATELGGAPAVRVQTLAEASSSSPRLGYWRKRLLKAARALAGEGGEMPGEVIQMAAATADAGRMADLLASHLPLDSALLQSALAALNPLIRMQLLTRAAIAEVKEGALKAVISDKAQGAMDKAQREYFLQKQLEAIKRELGEESEGEVLAKEYRAKAAKAQLPANALELLEKQLQRLQRVGVDSQEAAGLRNYLETLLEIPWDKPEIKLPPIAAARGRLDEAHYGLEKIKTRVLEYLAVKRVEKHAPPPRLCFLGPPGVGKTSLARAIATALDRPFVRASLGGVRDEAEIRGHRRTYVGAMPGRIIQGLIQAKSNAPVFLLDEIDKLGASREGDPAAALLEVMDEEQNKEFRDHFLAAPLDLSEVFFIVTANDADGIPDALFDRFEYLELRGYTEEEKVKIARQHLWPRLMKATGGEKAGLTLPGDALLHHLIRRYTYEAGLRELGRALEKMVRHALLKAQEGGKKAKLSEIDNLSAALGPPRYSLEKALREPLVGVATGIAWTEGGGDLLMMECVAYPGGGSLSMTGQLGEVMRESGQAAISYLKAHGKQFGADPGVFSAYDFHIHVPAGAVPKDGPSAGITLLTALLSLITRRPVRRDLAMSGEITLRGEILPVGGVPEKLMAARRAGLKEVILPEENQKDESELPAEVRRDLKLTYVKTIEQVLKLALLPAIGKPLKPEKSGEGKKRMKKK
jgi:ATP-dependent Lon protease